MSGPMSSSSFAICAGGLLKKRSTFVNACEEMKAIKAGCRATMLRSETLRLVAYAFANKQFIPSAAISVAFACTMKASERTESHRSPVDGQRKEAKQERGAIAEWTVTVLLLLFGTTTLVQAFVIPTGSMEDTLLVGDHLLVDKLAYAPPGPISKYLLPYTDVKRGDIIVFRYPVDIRQTFVKRVIGVPGDRIRIENKQLIRNGVRVNEPYKYHKTEYNDSYRDNFPSQPYLQLSEGAIEMLEKHVVNGEVVVPPEQLFRHGRQSRQLARQPLLGFCAAREHHRQTPDHLLVLRDHNRPSGKPDDQHRSCRRSRFRTSSRRLAGGARSC